MAFKICCSNKIKSTIKMFIIMKKNKFKKELKNYTK